MPGVKGGIYQRGPLWLDFARGAGGEPVSPFFYIHWYDPGRGRQRRKSTGTGDVRLACDALDEHFLATHRPDESERRRYAVAQALTDYYLEVGQKRSSAISIKSRLLLFTRFMDTEAAAGRLHDPFLPEHVDDQLMDRFRAWGVADPIIARRRNEAGDWERSGARRVRAASTVEESVIQVGAAFRHAKFRKRLSAVPEFACRTRAMVTPVRNDRLTVSMIGELLDYAARGGSGRYATPERLMALRRYLIAAVATLGRPDAILDISVKPERMQWLAGDRRLDLNPAGRVQTRKYRAVLPVGEVFANWLEATDEWFVCMSRREPDPATGEKRIRQIGVASVRSAWDTAREHLGLPQGWGPKLLRHSMATILANRSVNPVEMKIALGHEPIGGSSARYIIFDPSYLKTFAAAVDDVFGELVRAAPAAFQLAGSRNGEAGDGSDRSADSPTG
jgi:hypothetical protein